MNGPFPFDLPGATAFYLTIYLLTLVIHFAFMHYVLAGIGYVTIASLIPGGARRPLTLILRDWIPFALSGAITAGVAPLLFIQILYKERFYTANLLLFHRWMAILPVLIIAFYMLYLLKSKRIVGWHPLARVAVAGGAFLCFAFTGIAWTENHLLSLEAESVWQTFYADQTIVYTNAQIPLRVACWVTASLASLCTLSGWQLRQHEAVDRSSIKTLCRLALIGLLLSTGAAFLYYSAGPEPVRQQATGPMAGPYAALAIVGLLLQATAWLLMHRRGELFRGGMILASVGLAATLVGASVVREAIRLSSIDLSVLVAAQERASQIGGLWLFLLFFVVNGALIATCIAWVRRGLRIGPNG